MGFVTGWILPKCLLTNCVVKKQLRTTDLKCPSAGCLVLQQPTL